MRKFIGAVLFFGSWLAYGVLIFIASNAEWTVAEKLGIGATLYGTSWIAFVAGSILLGPEFIEKVKKYCAQKTKKEDDNTQKNNR